MTIAMCYVSPEGVVLGADSAASFSGPEGLHYLNNAQKLFEIGEKSTLGMLIWGVGGLPNSSFRTVIASLGDDFAKQPPSSVQDAMDRWIDKLWPLYTTELAATIARGRALAQKPPFDAAAATPAPNARTKDEETEYRNILSGGTGFCLGGYVLPDRKPAAFSTVFEPLGAKPKATAVNVGGFWGAPNTIERLVNAADARVIMDIANSAKWTGTAADLQAIRKKYALEIPPLPIRDAIDFVHSCIYTTIKGHKFSSLAQTCGGPIEIAVIRTDRPFHWVEHKAWNAAIREGSHHERPH
jgi:hypothetical protein